MRRSIVALLSSSALLSFSVVSVAHATHSWGGYHWARTANPLPLKLGDNVTATWDAHLLQASSDWNAATGILNTSVVTGKTTPKTCKPVAGRGEVCNAKYGNNGWLGIAQIWISGGHITQGTVKLNDTYFNTATHNTPAWRDLVTCQEVGHIFGLGHQDENFSNTNLNTCMDYTNSPESNRHPNQHDYDLLASIYEHLDTTNSYSSTADVPSAGGGSNGKPQDVDWNEPSEWGRKVSEHAFARKLNNGDIVITDVFWVDGKHDDHTH